MKKVLVSIAHPDDETIGCGGTISNHIAKGDKVFCISMTNGVGARFTSGKNLKLIEERKKAAQNASKKLGFKWLKDCCGNFPDNGLDTVKLLEIIKLIEKAKKKVNPNIVYTHNYTDLNIDHKIVCEATLTAFRPQPKENWEKIFAIEIPSATDYGNYKTQENFNPNYFVNIKSKWKKKLSALKCYKKEMRNYPHSRSYKGLELLAKLRGTQVGLNMVEAFKLIKSISR